MKLTLVVLVTLLLTSCGSIPKSNVKCTNGFKNGSQVLTDTELALAWSRAQQVIAQGKWITNALSCDPDLHYNPPPCLVHAPDARALRLTPNCVSVKGVNGLLEGKFTGEQSGNAIAIDIDYPHDKVINLADWEFQNVMGERLGFDTSDR